MHPASQNQNQTMSSLDYLKDFINPAREAAGESKLKPWQGHLKIADEFEPGEVVVNKIDHQFRPDQSTDEYHLAREQTTKSNGKRTTQ